MKGNEYAELRAFVAVVDQSSFARAAEHLRIAPSTLSQTIRELEERLGTRLLNRTTRSVSPTPAGARLHARLRPAMAELDASVDAVRDSGGPRGVVRLHIPRLAAATFLEPALGSFFEAYPDVELDVTLDDAVVDIVEAGFDVGVRLGERLERDSVVVPLGGELRQLAVASPGYVARHGRPETPHDLHAHRCINWRQPGRSGIYAWEFHKNGSWFSVAVDGPLVVNDRRLALAAAVQGVGIALWDEGPARPLVEAGRLVVLLEEWLPPFPGWHLYHPRQSRTPAAVLALVEHLRGQAAGA